MLERPLKRAGRVAAAYATANQVTWAGFACGVAAAALVAVDWAPVGLAFLLLARLADGLDGAIAYERGPTAFGGFLDVALDLIVYIALGFAFAIRAPESVLASAFFVGAFAILMTTELSLRHFVPRAPAHSRAETEKLVSDVLTELGAVLDRGERVRLSSIGTFKVGPDRWLQPPLIGHAETSIVLAVSCAYPPAFPLLAYFYGALCFFASGRRVATAMDHLKDAPP